MYNVVVPSPCCELYAVDNRKPPGLRTRKPPIVTIALVILVAVQWMHKLSYSRLRSEIHIETIADLL